MVSPTSCMLPLGGSGDNPGGSAHLQAATSTTPEVGTGVGHHNFLLDVGGTGIGASPPSHMKHEIGGASEWCFLYTCLTPCGQICL